MSEKQTVYMVYLQDQETVPFECTPIYTTRESAEHHIDTDLFVVQESSCGDWYVHTPLEQYDELAYGFETRDEAEAWLTRRGRRNLAAIVEMELFP